MFKIIFNPHHSWVNDACKINATGAVDVSSAVADAFLGAVLSLFKPRLSYLNLDLWPNIDTEGTFDDNLGLEAFCLRGEKLLCGLRLVLGHI